MKKASGFEIIAARCWNMLNEGRPFTPIFVMGVYALYHLGQWGDPTFWALFGIGLFAALPIFILYFVYDFPLFLRNYLWFPVIGALVIWRDASLDFGIIRDGTRVVFLLYDLFLGDVLLSSSDRNFMVEF